MDDHVDSEDAAVEDDADAPGADDGAAGADDPDVDDVAGANDADADAPDAAAGATDGEEAAVETLADRVAAADAELGDEVAELRSRAEALESERDELRDRVEDLESKLKRNRADFQNYKKRAKKKQDQIRDRATEDLVERLVKVRDNLVRALEQDADADDIRDGIESTLREFDRVLEDENVSTIEPDAGDEVDPHRHEVMMRVEGDTPEGTVADVYQPGYEMAEKVVRPAQVTVSTGEGDGDEE